MSVKNNKTKFLILSLFIVPLFFQIFYINQINNSIEFPKNSFTPIKENINDEFRILAEESGTEQWLENPTFESPIEPTWFWRNGTEGDNSDIKATIGEGQANFGVLGESGEFSLIVDPSNTTELTKWETFKKSEFILYPDFHSINESGFHVSHYWNESAIDGQDKNTPSVRWKRNITMDDDMSDYIITSASIEAKFNATVQAITLTNGGIEVPGDDTDNGHGGSQNNILDYARFSVEISNLENTKKFELTHNQTRYLGDDDVGDWDNITDTLMTNNVDEEVLIAYLTSILDDDPFHKSFTIILGIDIYCADNYYGPDEDNWKSLIIRSLNLTFTYEKKVDQFTFVSWNQIGDKVNSRIADIPNATIDIYNATLNFRYKIDQTWPNSSPNSEIRIKIGNNQHTETLKLSLANSSFQEAKSGGFDVSSLILKDENISLSIQVFLADTFGLDRNITISIDEVYLYISYTILTIEPDWSWLIFLLIFTIIVLITIFSLYQLHYKHPPMVRKIRKLRKKIRKERKLKPILIHKREKIVNKRYKNGLQILKVEPIQSEKVIKIKKNSKLDKIKELQEGGK